MKITVTRLTSWKEVLNSARITQRNEALDKEPSEKFKKSIIKSMHSPIRCLVYNIDFQDIPYYVSVHLVRHIHAQPFVSTSRPDIDGKMLPRDEQKKTDLVNMRLFLSAEEIINISKVRLCNKAEKETKKIWKEVVNELSKIDPILANACVPNCVFRNGICPEMKCCGYINTDNFKYHLEEYLTNFSFDSIKNKDNKVEENDCYDYVELSGIKFATKFIGASSPYIYDAKIFQWGDIVGHRVFVNTYNYNKSTQIPNVQINNDNLNSEFDAAVQLMGKSPLKGYHWRMMTKEELSVLINCQLSLTNTTVKGVDGTEITIGSIAGVGTVGGIKGMCFGKTTTSVDNVLFLPFHGYGFGELFANIGFCGNIWSSSVNSSNPQNAWNLYFNDTGCVKMTNYPPFYGCCILGVLAQD